MTIKINASSAIGITTAMRDAPRLTSGFSLSESDGVEKTARPQAAMASTGILGMDAILALQGEDDALGGKRRRQMRRANDILDSLEEVKISVLSGELSDTALLSLKSRLEEHQEDVQDERLRGILNEVETRAYVELAKRKLM